MRTSTILILLGCLLRAGLASAGDVGVVVTGDATVRDRLTTQLDEWFRSHGHTPVDSALPPEATKALLACVARSDEPCAHAVLVKRGALPSLVVAKAEIRSSKEGIADVELTAYWFRTGQDTVAERRFCERCTDQMMRQSSDELLSALVTSDAVTTAHVTLTSVPAGATVLVDGAAIGATPLTYDIAAGRHQLTITAPGHDVDTRQIVLRSGETTHIDVPLTSSGHVDSSSKTTPPTPHSSPPVAAISLVALGGGAIIAGAICIAVDQDAGPHSPLHIRDTAPLGVGLLATGVVASAAGGYLWFRHRSSSAPVASISSAGGYIGWAGSF